MKRFYYCSHENLEPDNVIHPGNWGKIILNTGPKHVCWTREIMLEAIRSKYFPKKPSRLFATFCCDSLDTIKCYQKKNSPESSIYEVKFFDSSMQIHEGDFNAVEELPGVPFDLIQISLKYWRYELKTSVDSWPGIICKEIVSESSLIILNKVL